MNRIFPRVEIDVPPPHTYCCQLRAAAEADLEKAWEVREGTKAIVVACARRSRALSIREEQVGQREIAANERDDRQSRRSWVLAAACDRRSSTAAVAAGGGRGCPSARRPAWRRSSSARGEL